MKVLHLPWNMASQISVMVRALRAIGVEARGLSLSANRYCDSRAIEVLAPTSRQRYTFRWLGQTVRRWQAVLRDLRWADVIHWHWGKPALRWHLCLRYAAFLGKPRLVGFCGTDLRIPEVASRDNQYVKEAYERGEMKRGGADVESGAIQRLFARYGFTPILRRFELVPYLKRDLFPRAFYVPQPVMLDDYEAMCPDPNRRVPAVIHCPSHRGNKATWAVLRAVEQLRAQCQFEFSLIEGLPRSESLAVVRESDIVLDQFILGDLGNLTMEAMALGKPVLCFVKPYAMQRLAGQFPVVNATPDSLPEALKGLLQDGMRRHEIGKAGRAYVEAHCDAKKVAAQLVRIYEQLLAERGTRSADQQHRGQGAATGEPEIVRYDLDSPLRWSAKG